MSSFIEYFLAAVGFFAGVATCYKGWRDLVEGGPNVVKNALVFVIGLSICCVAVAFVFKAVSLNLAVFQAKCPNIAKEIPEDPECATLAYKYDKTCSIPAEFATLAHDRQHALVQFCLWLHAEDNAGTLKPREEENSFR